MKKILSVLICVVLGISNAWAADLTINAKAYVYNSTGGQVAANQSTTTPTSGWATSSTNQFKKGHDSSSWGTNKWKGYALYYHAKSAEGYTFMGWSNDDNSSVDDSQTALCLNVSSTKEFSQFLGGKTADDVKTRYAVFKPILTPAFNTLVLYLADDGSLSTYKLPVTCNKVTNLDYTCSSDVFNITSNASSVLQGNDGEQVEFTIAKNPDSTNPISLGENVYTLTLTPSNSNITSTDAFNPAPVVLNISIRKAPTVTFLPATGGSYTFLQDNGLGRTISVTNQTVLAGVVGNGNDKQFQLSAAPATGYRFRRWVINRSIGGEEYLYNATTNVPIECDATVSAEFISEECAMFIILDDPSNKQYAHMDDAFAAAQKIGKTVVSVYQPETVTINTDGNGNAKAITRPAAYKYEWKLPKPASGTYTIPAGYTLLVPGLDKSNLKGAASTNNIQKQVGYTYLLDKTTVDDYLEAAPTPRCMCKLTVESGTTIQVNGNISVYSCLSAVQGYTGRPTGYGQIHLENGSQIQVNDGAILHVLGYITGDPNESSVIAKKGSDIYEVFQLTDWRGGSGMGGGEPTNFLFAPDKTLVNNTYEVFPAGQYYVQSIETMLQMEAGAMEYLTTGVDVGSPFPVTSPFITVSTTGEDKGLLALGDSTIMQKYYDGATDRLKINVIGLSENAKAEISYMYLEVKVDVVITKVDATLDSREYVLPINNNIDLLIDNVTMDCPYKLAFMAGATMNVTNDANLNILNELYVYDSELNVRPDFTEPTKDANGTVVNYGGYYGAGSSPLKPITYTAYHGKEPKIRTSEAVRYPEKLEDATLVIDGTLTMDVNGALYTTTYSNVIKGITDASEGAQVRDFGANITSNGGGVMNFKHIGTNSTTNQINQTGTSPTYITNIPVCNAWLRNADGSRSGGPDVEEGTTYMYIDGVWDIPQAELRNPKENTFTITLPADKTQNVECEVVEHNVSGTTFTYQSIEGPFVKDGDVTLVDGKLTIPVKYKPKNIHNKDAAHNEGKIIGTLTYTDPLGLSKSKSVEIPLYGIEDYTPVFDVTIGEQTFTSSGTYSKTISGSGVGEDSKLPVKIASNSDNIASTASVQWIDAAAATSTPFVFNYGTSDSKLSAAQLIYRPTAVGSHSGVLTIEATYTDANSNPITSSIAITLNAKVDYKLNTLKFADFPDEIYFEDYVGENPEEPFLMLDPTSNNAGTTPTYTLSGDDNVIEITGDGTAANPYKIKPISKGTTTIYVTQSASTSVEGANIDKPITVKSRYDELPAVTLCVKDKTMFDAINVSADKVTYNNVNNSIDFAPSATWQFQFRGVPNQLTFTPNGDNAWRILERASAADDWSVLVQWTNTLSGREQTFLLKPTTRFVQIQYGAQTNNVGTITDLCVSKLDIAADLSKVYMPVYYTTTDKASTQTIILTHTAPSTPAITLSSPLTYTANTNENNLGTIEEPFYTTTVVVSAAPTVEEGTYTLKATQGTDTANVAIRTYKFPQELPIKLAEDPEERYHFVTAASNYAKWNPANKQIIFQNPGAARIPRTVTFAFNGAPSIIKFDLSEDVVDANWTIEESVDGIQYSSNISGRDSQEGNTLTHQLHYTTRYVRVTYTSELTSEVFLSNLVIEGYPQAIVSPEKMFFTTNTKQQKFFMIAINLQNVDFELDNSTSFRITTDTTYVNGWSNKISATESTHGSALGLNKVDTIFLGVEWLETTALDEGKVTIKNVNDQSILAVVPLLGSNNYLVKEQAHTTGIYTGIPDGSVDAAKNYTYNNNVYSDYKYHSVNLINAFDEDGTAIFDYLFIYGETTPSEGTNITLPLKGSADGRTNIGSNAVTPLIVYKKAPNTAGKYMGYQYVGQLANVNTAAKEILGDVIVKDDAGTVYIDVMDKTISAYMTGFCPFATTGYDKLQEGVFLFRGKHGSKLDLYLEDFHVLSRNKTENGNAFYGNKEGGTVYSDLYARGSGGVLVFENVDIQEELHYYQPFDVNIHTMGNNLLNSNYGCFFALQIGGVDAMRAYQVSSPIQVHVLYRDGADRYNERKTKTNLNFDDIWPTVVDDNNVIIETKRTNGFLALKKQANNAPSIDLGNANTVVNFNGGQVQLQNSQIGSDTYKTTLAISYRAGFFGSNEAGIQLCYGIGTDAVDGTVNFNDGTVTIEPMWVSEAYKQYYLIDQDANGNEITQVKNGKTEYRTTCLRTPTNTYVQGGSICRVRACQHVTSKGGAPKDTKGGSFLGQYVYTLQSTDEVDDETTNLVKKIAFPDNISGLKEYQESHGYEYGLSSITPDANRNLYFWIPDGYAGVEAEEDKILRTWKACMTEIGASLEGGVGKGTIGGDIEINEDEEVKYFLYCQLDNDIHNVISAVDGNGAYTYQAPIEVPAAAKQYFDGNYTRWAPNLVGSETQHQVLSGNSYTITDRVYYITTATADLWKTFTAPFNVANIYVVEAFSEAKLETMGTRSEILKEQARHNADFAAFFGVAMAMGSDKSFKAIYESYLKWAEIQDQEAGLPTDGTYTLRGMQKLTPYFGNNWRDANFYLNVNKGNWALIEDGTLAFDVKWEMLNQSDTTDGILLHKDSTYSMMFPYCTGCEVDYPERDYWDYWSGKFLIFESTTAPQTIKGKDFLNEEVENNIFTVECEPEEVVVTGNSTFAMLETNKTNVYRYSDEYPSMALECFKPINDGSITIYPATAFLYGEVPNNINNMPAKKVTREGKIIYGDSSNGDNDDNGDNTTTDSHIPTVGGGNDLFITAINGGINIAVAEPQYVRVLTATGAIIFNGYITTAADVNLPTQGIYVISGENEVQKIFY